VFYLNTFNVAEYIQAVEAGHMPIALSMPLSERMQMASWLYWRVYETRFSKRCFKDRFGTDFDREYGKYFWLLSRLNLCMQGTDEIVLTSDGAYWLHALQDLFSTDYVSKLWGTSQQEPWPERIEL
jgi:oxygen-independent coproporphyrinogen-3 oxidase